ncbi:phosphoglycerate mutase-like protein [Annulohypoxylon truncatum]|uniref:phosphoglycerate mutase-like protein n=1 Tax=Annulohypoxylon truncatum TaxID=327061 RepID=UPI002008BDED|nr:phosphoglycerate mutase-like protein [Annulohypoxylon truncatum]KAI1210892.1 phosphoglycerate mutase-like protein [Annulohypoxylon truncatum]
MVFTDLRHQLKALVAGRWWHRYTLLPGNVTHDFAKKRTISLIDTRTRIYRLVIMAIACVALIAFSVMFMYVKGDLSAQKCNGSTLDRHCRLLLSRLWGQYTSSFPVPSEISPDTPKSCEVTFVQLLSRHGARYPTEHKSSAYGTLIDHIHNSVTDYGKGFEFIKDYKYTLGADQLTSSGEQQMVMSGEVFYERYKHLTRIHTPFVRSSGQERVVDSAKRWTEGFHEARLDDETSHAPDTYPYKILIIPETKGFNNSLSPDLCPAFEDSKSDSDNEKEMWMEKVVSPLTDRLNQNLPGANLTNEETIDMMDLCPFETVADKKTRLSRFCQLFTMDDWRNYDYYQSLGKWYGYGNGSPLGPTQGVGFVNELLSRLTGKPVDDHTTTNSTLDGFEDTFPHGRALYADFSHDNDMMDIYGALGLYNLTAPLPGNRRVGPQKAKGFSASWAVPFAARLYVEKMTCEGDDEELVRILVNDRVIPLQNCGADVFGRCKLSKFVESQSFARSGGHWDQCFV